MIGNRDIMSKTLKRISKLPSMFRTFVDVIFINELLQLVPSYRVRYFFYRSKGMKIGKGSALFRKCYLQCLENIEIGKDNNIGFFCRLDGRGGLKIGNNVNISSYCIFESGGHDLEDFTDTFGEISVEDNVWIGTRCLILAGVTIGEGAVVGAGSVVTKDVAPYTVVAGVPAKFIKERSKTVEYRLNGMPIFH